MEAVNELMKEVVHVFMYHLIKHLDYMISYKRYEKDMRTKMESLDIARVGEKEHLDKNRTNRLVVPVEVTPWLEKVEKIQEKVENFPREDLGCLDLKSRYKLGSKAAEITKEIDSVLPQHSLIQWTDQRIAPGRIDSTMIISSDHGTEFRSREQTITKALEVLRPNHSSHMVALCGMGGVGKTTMMKKLKEVVAKENLFTDYVEAVIGEKTDPIAVQQAVAEFLGINLTDTTKSARTETLRKWFLTNNSNGAGKKKFLVILDDVWQSVDMEDIGLSRLPNRGVDFKVLITSRDQAVCTVMGVRHDSVFMVNALEEAEAQNLFDQHWVPSHDDDYHELHQIGKDIVKKCHGLPIAIKTMACTLTGKSVDTWKNALDRLQNHDIKTFVNVIFETSYVNLRNEVTEVIFLLCGLFPEDFNIPTEELMWYGWGLNLFKGVGTMRQARYKLNASIERLIHTNLLIKSDFVGYVKMHDLVRAFVLGMCSEHSIVNHGSNKPGWPAETDIVRASCKKISLTCKGMIEFPSDLNFPNLSILKLMHGGRLLSFPEGFYEGMGKHLQVISYDEVMTEYPMPLFSSQLTSLRVLRLHRCSLEFDDHLSSIGNLLNLEVLSFAKCSIKSLPISIGKLNKLRVLDVTGCDGLCIDYGIFKNLHSLEELYACASKIISFTGDDRHNYNHEVAQRWQNISSLKIEFLKFDAQLKHLSFEKLERFQISVGRSEVESLIFDIMKDTSENSLRLVTTKTEVLKSGINKFFKKTVVLCLSVDDMNDLEDIGVIKSSLPPDSSPFFKLKVLFVYKCAKLRYLFTPGVAKLLSNLEHLRVSNCPVMKQLIYTEDRGEETITFPKLEDLYLSELPELLGLCQNVNIIIALPDLVELHLRAIPNITSIYPKNTSETSCLFREKILIPKLKKLLIHQLENLEEIWPSDFVRSEEVKLGEIKEIGSDNLVNMFPCDPMPLLHHLEELEVWYCGSIKALFKNIDLDCDGEIEKGSICSSNLRRIVVYRCNDLVHLFPRNPMPLLCHLEELEVSNCGSIEVLFNINDFDYVAAIEKGSIISLRSIEVVDCDKLVDLFLCINTTPLLHHPEKRRVDDQSALVRDETGEGDNSLSSCYKFVNLFPCINPMPSLHHPAGEGKDGSNFRTMKVTELGKQVSETGGNNKISVTTLKLPNLNSLTIDNCHSLKHIFTFSTFESLIQLEELSIAYCKAIKVIVEKTTMTSSSSSSVKFPRLKCISLDYLPELVGFFLGTDIEFHWPSLDELTIDHCQRMRVFTAGRSTAPQLKNVKLDFCRYSPECWFNSHLTTTTTTTGQLHQKTPCPSLDSSSSSCPAATTSEENNIWSFHNLIELYITRDNSVRKIIPSNELLQVQKLQNINVNFCTMVEEIFEALEAGTNSTIGFDKSQTTTNVKLPNLTEVELQWLPRLTHIWRSNQWTVFEFPNLTTLDIIGCKRLKHVFGSSMVGSILRLQELNITSCDMEEVFVVEEDKESEGKTNEIVFHCLKSLELSFLRCLKGFCIAKVDFSFPFLDTLTINKCPAITTFTTGNSSTLNLKEIETGFDSFCVEENINSFIKMKQNEFNRDKPDFYYDRYDSD